MVVEGPEAITVMRTLMGKTNARESAPGTIRGDLGASRQMNLIHGSDGPDAAGRRDSNLLPIGRNCVRSRCVDSTFVGEGRGIVGQVFCRCLRGAEAAATSILRNLMLIQKPVPFRGRLFLRPVVRFSRRLRCKKYSNSGGFTRDDAGGQHVVEF
jgi:hypothetical protein